MHWLLRLTEFRTSQNRGEIPRRKSSQTRRGNIADKPIAKPIPRDEQHKYAMKGG
jgi:hypothetical protein